MRRKFKILPGSICIFDKDNILKRTDNSLIVVEVLKKSHRCVLFGPRYFTVIGIGKDEYRLKEPIDVPETLLFPSNTIVIRYPSDFPELNDLDLASIDYAINVLINNKDVKHASRLMALKEKMDICMKIREV